MLAGLGEQGVFARMPWVAPQNRCIRVSCGPGTGLDAFAEALPQALAAARGLMETDLDGETVARRAMAIAAEICVYTNGNLTVETIPA